MKKAALLAVAVCLAAACGSSATTSTAPSSISRCAVTLAASEAAIPASGGSGTVTVSAARECAWTAAVEGGWLSIRSGANGQGDGSVEFTTTANADPQTRTGAVVVNGQRAQITQAAGVCDITLPESSASFPPAGGSRRIDVRASSPLCPWSVSSDSSWIEIKSGATGQGSNPVMIEVAPTTGPPRNGSLTIAGQRFSVTQSQGCAYAIAPSQHAAGAAGGSGTVAVTTTAGCPWTAASNDPWITVSPASGSGPGPVTFTIAATTGPIRTGSAVIAGQPFSVTQSQGCTYSISPTSQSVPTSGGSGNVAVTAGAGCQWTATSNAPWLTISSGSDGSGNGTVTFTAAPSAGPARSGTLTIATRTFTVSQADSCTSAIAPQEQTIGASGGPIDVAVTTPTGCTWTASSAAPWITVTSGGSGAGNGVVRLTVSANAGPPRTGTATIAGRTFTVNQGSGCTYTVAPPAINAAAAGGPARIDVSAAAGCAWTAVSNAAWISVTPPGSGSGNGAADLTIAANSGPSRSGAVAIAGQSLSITQEPGCTFTLNPTSQAIGQAGGPVTVQVAAAAGCAWSAASSAPWIVVTAGSPGSGNGTVQLTVAANTSGAPRSASVTIGGQTFTVNQE